VSVSCSYPGSYFLLHREHSLLSTTKTTDLMMYRKVFMVSENHMEPINTLRFKCQQQVVHIVTFNIEMVNESYMVIRSLQ